MASLGTPAFRLYILRHARAAWAQPGQSDFDRALDDDGFAEAEVIAEEAADQGYKPALIISSTAVRCRQTAEPFHRTVSEELSIEYVDSLYSGTVDAYAELAFADRPETSVMIVGHNPMIEEFFHRLVGKEIAETAVPFGFPTAGLAILDFDQRPTEENHGGACLAGFMMPRPAH
ncbi:MAG: SixA phosphatase family protein [Shinella sp.]|uniref:SixA phosphatase family protein n=1 Tax=Shinella sp. TaxID=1870904 RepID=UPI004035AC23